MQLALDLSCEAEVQKNTLREYEIKLDNPSLKDVKAAFNELESVMGYDKPFPYQKIKVEFSGKVRVQVNRRKAKDFKEMKVKFFESTSGIFAYTFFKSSGYAVSNFDYRKIKRLSIQKEDREAAELRKIKKLLNRVHPNAWPNLKDNPESLRGLELGVINIKNRFPKHVIDSIKDAFENKKDYRYQLNGDKRDWTVSVEVRDGGYVLAWFSSEFCGYAHGDYYLLINPTTATFKERD
ncbi:hypothetical protein J2S74_002925 [Evansella vedderi]|uniref:Large polyvalent protein associated domain-containing protein n=1 Tax=Evansella vedderi TaxID=38282 RepID=A0ABT9ZWD1_9BACI|nr:hypothetical protein [Evansella vedderi]MDQ0255543.1 hypothetical protein [Evansella vedderi]